MFQPWIPPKTFEGQTVVVVGSGKSLVGGDVRYCHGRAPVIAINDNYRMAPWADVLYAADAAWWRLRSFNLEGVGGLRVGLAWDGENKRYHIGWDDEDVHGAVNCLGSSGVHGVERNFEGYIRHGGNSGYQAVQLAIAMGASRILLLGFDMRPGRWFGDYPASVNKNGNHAEWCETFGALARCGALEEMGVEIINCTPDSAMECFDRQNLRDIL